MAGGIKQENIKHTRRVLDSRYSFLLPCAFSVLMSLATVMSTSFSVSTIGMSSVMERRSAQDIIKVTNLIEAWEVDMFVYI
jgi:hypothetical protein